MMTPGGFYPVAEVTVDRRGGIVFGEVGLHANDRYAVSINKEGAILLIPLANIPKRELAVWDNGELRASLLRGLVGADEGKAWRADWLTNDDDG